MTLLTQSYPEDVLARLHERLLEILDAIAEICDRHDIQWYIGAGSALGAARHGGFIPWDDDVDACMLREHYERFIEIAPRELDSRFEMLIPGVTPNYAPLFSKICLKGTRFWTDETIEAGLDQGIFVDVWVRDRVAADPAVRKRQERASFALRSALYLYHSENMHADLSGPLAKIAPTAFHVAHKALHALTSDTAIRKAFAKYARIDPDEESCGTTSLASRGFYIVPEEYFVDCEKIPFEGRMFPAPTPIDDYCRISYGENWRELPPVEKRANHAPLVLDFGDGVNVFGGEYELGNLQHIQ